jgi:hypothetical protein
MKILSDVALWLQTQLLGLDREEWGLVYFVHRNLDSVPQYTDARWQLGVDTAYRTVTCGMVEVEGLGGFPDLPSFFQAIRTLSPDDKSGAVSSTGEFEYTWPDLWNAAQVCGTQRLSKLVDAYFPPGGETRRTLNLAFIAALEQIFAENGVPWSEKPLLPVMPKASVGATEPR